MEAIVGERRLVTRVRAGGGYQASNDDRVILATGDATKLDELRVWWPCGNVEAWDDLPVRPEMVLLEGTGRLASEAAGKTAPPPGDSPPVSEQLTYPLSIAVNGSGIVYLADRNLPGVWRLEGDRLSLFFQGSKTSRTPLSAVRCVAIDNDGRLLAGDSSTRDVYRFDENGTPRPLTAQGRGIGRIGIPMDIVVDLEGNLLVSDLETGRIVSVPIEGGQPEEFATLPAPRGLFYDSRERLWAISGRTLVRFSPAGEAETIVGEGVFRFPHGVVVEENGVAYVTDGHAQTIWRVVPGRKPEKWIGGEPLDNPVGMDIYQGRLLVADPRDGAVFELDEAGNLTRRQARPAEP